MPIARPRFGVHQERATVTAALSWRCRRRRMARAKRRVRRAASAASARSRSSCWWRRSLGPAISAASSSVICCRAAARSTAEIERDNPSRRSWNREVMATSTAARTARSLAPMRSSSAARSPASRASSSWRSAACSAFSALRAALRASLCSLSALRVSGVLRLGLSAAPVTGPARAVARASTPPRGP